MPKTLTPAMRAHLEEETTRLAAIWRITRKDGAQFFFTDHDRDIVFGGDTANDVLAPYENDSFASGALTFETGSNAGRTLEIKSWTQTSRTLELWEPAKRAVQVGDQFRLYAGCSKRVIEDCRDRLQSPAVSCSPMATPGTFRGEPYVPGGALVAQVL